MLLASQPRRSSGTWRNSRQPEFDSEMTAAYEYKFTRGHRLENSATVDCPESAHEYWCSIVESRDWFTANREHVVTIFLNTRCRVVGHHLVGLGSINECTAHPRDVLGPVLCASAHSFVLMHNHPSGDPSPSSADHVLTRKIRDGADLLNVELADHVIIGGPDSWFSFRETGLI